MNSSKIAYIHGRPGHSIHHSYARSIGADPFPVDFYLRWQDIEGSSRFRRYLSWILCSLFFPDKKKYKIFLTECIRFPVIMMRWLGLLDKQQKIVALMDDESLFFLHSGRYSKLTSFVMIKYLQSCDALICVGQMQTNLARSILEKNCPPVYTIINGISTGRFHELSNITPSLSSKNILFIANVDVEWRAWYKGTDLIFKAFGIAANVLPHLKLILIGRWDVNLLDQFIDKYCPLSREKIINVGYTDKLDTYIENSSLYLHCARGEAWGISITEAMCGGVIPIVSEWTGAREVVEQVDPFLVVPPDEKQIAEKIIWFFNLPLSEQKILSAKCKETAKNYTEEKAIEVFKTVFKQIVQSV